MARSFSKLAAFSLSVSALALSAAAQAQNYVAPANYSGPNVVIDFGTLDQAAPPNRWAIAPVTQEPLMAPPPPPKLTPPPVRQPMRMMALKPQPLNNAQPRMIPDSVPMVESTGDLPPAAPVMPNHLQQNMQAASISTASAPTPVPAPQPMMQPRPMAMPAPMPAAAPLPAPTDFSARDMLMNDAPPAQAPAPAPKPMAVPAPVPTPVAAPAPVSSFSSKTGSMLAQARKNSSQKADRVNLASLSDGPPLPMRNQEPVASPPVIAAPKPVAPKPMLPKPVAPAPKPMAPAPVATMKNTPPALPPATPLSDLEQPHDNAAMQDVITKTTTAPAPKPVEKPPAPVAKKEPMLPPTVQPLHDAVSDLDTEDRPASQASSGKPLAMPEPIAAPVAKEPAKDLAAEHVSLKFAKDMGALDDGAKKDLDIIIKALKKDKATRAQIRAYASGTPETSGQARRLSLTRALAARSYVVDQDIPATRLDIRALGNGQTGLDKPETGDMDRVDITLVK